MNIKLKRILGVGFWGTVYLSEIDGVPAASKIEKYNGDDTTTSSFVRQIKFNEFAKKHPNQFLTLHSYCVVNNCTFQQPIPKSDRASQKVVAAANKLPRCSILSYQPVLKYSFKQLEKSLTLAQRLDCAKQVHKSIKLMRSAGYIHRDIHAGNLMAKPVGNKYHWYIIDYGAIWHDSFIRAEYDDFDWLKPRLHDEIGLLYTVVKNPTIEYVSNNKLKFPAYANVVNYIKKSAAYKSIADHLPKSKLSAFERNDLIVILCVILSFDTYLDATHLSKKIPEPAQIDREYLLRLISNI